MYLAAKKEHYIATVDPSTLSLYKDGKYAGRFPSSFKDAIEGVASGPTNPNPSPTLGNSKGTALIDPYKHQDKAHFEDIMYTDGTAQEAIMLLVKSVLSKQLQTVTDSRKQYATAELRKQAVEVVINNKEYQKILIQVKDIDTKVKLHERLMGAQAMKYAFGRAALGIVFKEGLPVDLKQFSSRNLGNVYADPKSWRLLGVEYYDLLVPRENEKPKIFKSEDLLYFTNMDYNLKASTLFYGVSKIKPIIGASVAKRIIIDEDMPELAKSMWAPKYLLPAPGVTTQAKLNAIANGLDPAKINVISADIGQPIVIPASDKLMEMMNTVHELDKVIIRGIGVPITMLPGYEDVTNRATIQSVLQGFMETRVEFERSVLQAQLDAQWYDTLLMEFTQKPIEELDYKISLEFQNLVMDTFKEKAQGVAELKNMGLPISDEAYLEMLGLDNLIDEIEEVKEEVFKEEEEQMSMRAEMMGEKPAPFGEKDK